MALLDLEKKISPELEDNVKILNDTLAQTQREIYTIKVPLARVPCLEKNLDKKDHFISKLKSYLHVVKSKVCTFLNDVLSRWKGQDFKVVIFIAYRDNVDQCMAMDFPSLHTLR